MKSFQSRFVVHKDSLTAFNPMAFDNHNISVNLAFVINQIEKNQEL